MYNCYKQQYMIIPFVLSLPIFIFFVSYLYIKQNESENEEKNIKILTNKISFLYGLIILSIISRSRMDILIIFSLIKSIYEFGKYIYLCKYNVIKMNYIFFTIMYLLMWFHIIIYYKNNNFGIALIIITSFLNIKINKLV